jgi:hypothetical protein
MNCHKTSQGSDWKCHKPSEVGIINHNLSQLDTINHNLSQNVRIVAYAALLQMNENRNISRNKYKWVFPVFSFIKKQ